MVSRENRVILLFGTVALVLTYGIWAFTGLPDWVAIGVLVGVGVVVPQLVTGYLESTD